MPMSIGVVMTVAVTAAAVAHALLAHGGSSEPCPPPRPYAADAALRPCSYVVG